VEWDAVICALFYSEDGYLAISILVFCKTITICHIFAILALP
jgi:hypothetical protein